MYLFGAFGVVLAPFGLFWQAVSGFQDQGVTFYRIQNLTHIQNVTRFFGKSIENVTCQVRALKARMGGFGRRWGGERSPRGGWWTEVEFGW